MSQTKPLRYGVNNVYYAVRSDDGTYGTPKRLRGCRQITISPEGSTEKFYADNGTYFVTTTNAGRSGSIELAGLNDDALVDLFNYVIDGNGIVLEDSDAAAAEVALLFDCLNDGPKPTKFAMYNVKFSRPNEEHNTTEDSASPDTLTMDYESVPIEITYDNEVRHFVGGHLDFDNTTGAQNTAYNAWYTSVQLPTKA